ncbi:MAG: hypothetical protein AAGD38_09155 [Acidobacteriota bacterium]
MTSPEIDDPLARLLERMSESLDPPSSEPPRSKAHELAELLRLADAIQRQNLRRRDPHASEDVIEDRLEAWYLGKELDHADVPGFVEMDLDAFKAKLED